MKKHVWVSYVEVITAGNEICNKIDCDSTSAPGCDGPATVDGPGAHFM